MLTFRVSLILKQAREREKKKNQSKAQVVSPSSSGDVALGAWEKESHDPIIITSNARAALSRWWEKREKSDISVSLNPGGVTSLLFYINLSSFFITVAGNQLTSSLTYFSRPQYSMLMSVTVATRAHLTCKWLRIKVNFSLVF